MKIYDKLSQLKKTIEEIKNISEKLGDEIGCETKIDDLNKEILRLKKGISENIEELEEFLGEKNA
tara:strand:- start:448 stop:642 length:195 start_codon:yes stop_codon:yes gene_type:complete